MSNNTTGYLANWTEIARASKQAAGDHCSCSDRQGCVAKTSGSLVEVVFVLTVFRLTYLVHDPQASV